MSERTEVGEGPGRWEGGICKWAHHSALCGILVGTQGKPG